MKNILYKVECALLDKSWTNGLEAYNQTNCQCTLTDNGFRIYRPSNLTVSANGETMWGGLRISNEANQFNLIKGHTYIILFDVNGKTTNAAGSIGWTNNMGWGGGGLIPSPNNTSCDWVAENFNGTKTCWYKWTINDDIYKVCTTSYSGFVAGNTYVSYRHFMFGFGYASTGSLGTDLYITNIRMYDITNDPDFKVEKYTIMRAGSINETSSKPIINIASEINTNSFYEI